VDCRLGSRGGGIDVGLLLARASSRKRSTGKLAQMVCAGSSRVRAGGGFGRLIWLAMWTRSWCIPPRLPKRPRFALGLSAAARMSEMDPTRPENMNRDRARSLHLRR